MGEGLLKFRSEKDVRAWLRKEADDLWWIENKRGGTVGMPDAVVAIGRRAVFLELKIAKPRKPTGWSVSLAPAQLLAIGELKRAGLDVWILAGKQGTSVVGALSRVDRLERVGKAIGRRSTYAVVEWCRESDSGQGIEALRLGT